MTSAAARAAQAGVLEIGTALAILSKQ